MQCMCKKKILTLRLVYKRTDNVVIQHNANIAIVLGVSVKLFISSNTIEGDI